MIRGIFFLAFLGILFLVGGVLAGQTTAGSVDLDPLPLPVWRDEMLVPGVYFNSLGAPALALDPDGRPHFVYGQNHLFHTWFDGRDWKRERIDSSPAWQRASVLAINDAGVIYIADYENSDLFLRILEPGGSWQTVRAPFPHLVNFSIVLDISGRPHIVAGPYYTPPNLFYLHGAYGPDGWSMEKIAIENAYDQPFSIAMDKSDQLVILYERYGGTNNLGGVWAALQEEGTWQHDRLAAGCLRSGSSLAVDSWDRVHALFSEDCDGNLIYAKENSQAWQMLPVTAEGREPALALDRFDRPHVVYGSDAGQFYVTREGSSWETTQVPWDVYAAWNNQLLLDSAGAAHIASLDTNLHYATNSGGQWQLSTPALQKRLGMVNAMALDANDTMHVLYLDDPGGALYWASGSEGDWEPELLAGGPSIGPEIALELDTQGRPHAAYLDGDRNELVSGMRQEDVWNWETIGAGGRQLSMAVDGGDRPHLALIQEGRITYWTKEDGDWVRETVAEEINFMGSVSLTVDSADKAHIAYSGSQGSFLASRQGANSWTREPLPFETVVELEFAAADQPRFLYSESRWEYDSPHPTLYGSLWFAERVGGEWSVERLWEDPDWDVAADLVMQINGPPRVALRSGFGDHVYLEREAGGAWLVEHLAWPGYGGISMAIGQDGQPRVLAHDGSSLTLSTREIVWLDKFCFMPVLVP